MTSTLRLEFDPLATITEPLTLLEVQQFCNLQNTDEDGQVSAMMKAARSLIEKETGIILSSRILIGVCDEWPGSWASIPPLAVGGQIGSTGNPTLPPIEFPVRPVTAISSIGLIDSDGISSTLNSGMYYLDKSGPVQRLWPSSTFSSSVTLRASGGIRVTFTAGWAACPSDLALALKQLVKHWYQNREPTRQGKSVNDIPMTAQRILRGNYLARL